MVLLHGVAVLHALNSSKWLPGWEKQCQHPAAYMMGIITRAAEMAG
jgi:hypothetical protein